MSDIIFRRRDKNTWKVSYLTYIELLLMRCKKKYYIEMQTRSRDERSGHKKGWE